MATPPTLPLPGLAGQIGQGASGALDLATGLFGKTSIQPAGGTTTGQTTFRPQDLASLLAQQQAFQQATQAFGQQAGQLSGRINPAQLRQIQAAPQLGSGGLDQQSQALISQEQQQRGAQAASQAQQLSSQLRNQPGIANILNQQNRAQAALGQNPLAFQAAQAQRGREAQQANLGLTFDQAANQALLQQQGAEQQAAQTQLGFGQAGLGAQQNLLANLLGLAKARGTTVQDQNLKTSKQRSGGLLK
jgi:hypothetical protein